MGAKLPFRESIILNQGDCTGELSVQGPHLVGRKFLESSRISYVRRLVTALVHAFIIQPLRRLAVRTTGQPGCALRVPTNGYSDNFYTNP